VTSAKATSENNLSAMKADIHKHSAQSGMEPSSTGEESRKTKSFETGPGQWSFRGRRSKSSLAAQRDVRKQVEGLKASKMEFQRRWSLREPSLTSSTASANIQISSQAQTVSSLSRHLGLSIPEYFRVTSKDGEDKTCQSLKKYPSQVNSHFNSNKTSSNLRKTPSSSSTSSIPSMVCNNKIQ
jgi:hypothetical protein